MTLQLACLHFKGAHWVSDCPTATAEQKKAAVQAFMDQKKNTEASTMKRFLQASDELEPKHVAFNGVVVMTYHPDNGTKYNVIPRYIVEEIIPACPTALTRRLEKPVDAKAVGGAIITCQEAIELDLELLTPAGKVRMRNVTCIITETKEDEFLLGWLTLKALGIDVDEQIAALANQEIIDFDPFESAVPPLFHNEQSPLTAPRALQHLAGSTNVQPGHANHHRYYPLDVGVVLPARSLERRQSPQTLASQHQCAKVEVAVWIWLAVSVACACFLHEYVGAS